MGVHLIRGVEHLIDAGTLWRRAAAQNVEHLKVGGFLIRCRNYHWRRHVDSRRLSGATHSLERVDTCSRSTSIRAPDRRRSVLRRRSALQIQVLKPAETAEQS
jgi:hypothetical protein